MKLYHLIYEQTDKRKVSLAVLTYQGKVLIVKRSKDSYSHAGKWGFPGGGIDRGETALKAVIRECEEEIGVRPIRVKKLAQNERITWFVGELPYDPLECIDLDYSEHDEWMLVDEVSMNEYEMVEGMMEIIVKVLSGEEEDEVK
jgi:mutator protein MutT